MLGEPCKCCLIPSDVSGCYGQNPDFELACCRYRKQTKRWQDYIRLFGFLAFVSLFLAVLFLQRNAQVAYQVSLQQLPVEGLQTLSPRAF